MLHVGAMTKLFQHFTSTGMGCYICSRFSAFLKHLTKIKSVPLAPPHGSAVNERVQIIFWGAI